MFFPWVVGIRGLLDPRHINALLEFLEIQKRHWQAGAVSSVLAFVRALHFMHRVRYVGSQGGQAVDRTLCTRTNTDEEDINLDEMEAQATRKRKPAAATVRTNTETVTATVHTDPPRERKMRRTHLGTYQRPKRSGSTMPSKAQRPPNGGGTHQASKRGRRCNNPRRHHKQRDTTGPGARMIPSVAPADREMNHRPDSPRLSRRKRKVDDGPNRMYDTMTRMKDSLNTLETSTSHWGSTQHAVASLEATG
jgi:hypothetical protein